MTPYRQIFVSKDDSLDPMIGKQNALEMKIHTLN